MELVFVKTVLQGEDVLCRPREPKEGQDQLMIKTLCGGMYWDLLDPVTCASTDVFVVVFFRSQLVLPKSGATERKYCFLSQIYRCGDAIFRYKMIDESSPVLSKLTSQQEAPRRGKLHLPPSQPEDVLANKNTEVPPAPS